MVGQALGAKKPERAEQAVKIAGIVQHGRAVGRSVRVLALLRAADRAAVHDRPERGAVRVGMHCASVACGFPFYAWGMVISQSFNGAGDTRTPTLLNLFVFWCWEIPLAYVLANPARHGPARDLRRNGDRILDVRGCGAAIFRRGHWKTKRV